VTASPARPSRGRLLQILGVAFGLAVIIGNTIGVGILRTPGDVATYLPNTTWFLGIWLLGGLYALLGALTLAELGAMVPESGGQYVFARRAMGDYAGFMIGWSDWISTCASIAAVTVSFGDYSTQLWPALQGRAVGVAIFVVILLGAIQSVGIKSGDLTQQVTSLLKTIVLVGLAGVCLFATIPESAPLATAVTPAIGFGAIVLALQGVVYTYDGWNGMLYFSGEVKNPGKDIPRSMAGGVIAIIAIYLLLNLAFLRVLGTSGMAGESLVAATAARKIFGDSGDTIVRAVLLVSLFSAANAILLMASRLPYGLGRDGLLWRGFNAVNAGGTPMLSLWVSVMATAILLLTGTFNQILALAAFFFVVNYVTSFLSVLILRRREPDTPRPYRAWGFPFTTWFLVLGSFAFLLANLYSDRRNGLISLALLAASYPVFRLIKRGQAQESGV
jgi:APA family basic amino acid/polyamine antiporter